MVSTTGATSGLVAPAGGPAAPHVALPYATACALARTLRRAAAQGYPVSTVRDTAGAPSARLRDPDGHTVALDVHPAAPAADPDERFRVRAAHLLDVLEAFA